VYIYLSYRKIKTALSHFWTTR